MNPHDCTGESAAATILRGQVMHQRLRPTPHRFVYPVFCVRVDLDRAAQAGNAWFGVDRRRLMSVRMRDYGPRDGSDLAAWVRARVRGVGIDADGAIWLQTFPRMFGFVFNPVSFFLCHDARGDLRAVLAEVNNTFGRTQHYLLSAPDGAAIVERTRLSCSKLMHVSPFCEVSGFYRFRFRDRGDSALVGIDYYDQGQAGDAAPTQEPLMRTSIGGRLQPMTSASALAALCAQPLLTVGVVARIHWQALLLWKKRVPWFGKAPIRARAAVDVPLSSEKEISP
ncbi:DUF1365 domain-containing protein [Herbaspirillum sp. LeCh32-8]|uniref:DUF1365 domain-containing protein n=1 Tax=Herbaspirillum sp. LeCh32-8 TaxID=2821356 RepID=UPI001AE1A9F0|nr:DUF1365 domain-containing protein [Herbaspirillum sp. LeCh32-8]MBP0598679.1 DUF1365 domain-containing protein [Herbaspirillum sp. LeCh32-8]